jgi:hypothetical protein
MDERTVQNSIYEHGFHPGYIPRRREALYE